MRTTRSVLSYATKRTQLSPQTHKFITVYLRKPGRFCFSLIFCITFHLAWGISSGKEDVYQQHILPVLPGGKQGKPYAIWSPLTISKYISLLSVTNLTCSGSLFPEEESFPLCPVFDSGYIAMNIKRERVAMSFPWCSISCYDLFTEFVVLKKRHFMCCSEVFQGIGWRDRL